MKRITISIDESTLDALDRLAAKLGVPGQALGVGVIAKRRSLLARQAEAMVAEQARH